MRLPPQAPANHRCSPGGQAVSPAGSPRRPRVFPGVFGPRNEHKRHYRTLEGPAAETPGRLPSMWVLRPEPSAIRTTRAATAAPVGCSARSSSPCSGAPFQTPSRRRRAKRRSPLPGAHSPALPVGARERRASRTRRSRAASFANGFRHRGRAAGAAGQPVRQGGCGGGASRDARAAHPSPARRRTAKMERAGRDLKPTHSPSSACDR